MSELRFRKVFSSLDEKNFEIEFGNEDLHSSSDHAPGGGMGGGGGVLRTTFEAKT